jgi:adrenodoxin-NADP+ reductase
LPALSVVHWYTGHPLSLYLASSSQHLSIDDALLKTRHLTLIGHGNVSLDIARILLSSPASLKTLDIPENVLKVLSSVSETIEHIDIISRRGPREVAFTAKELREILNLEGVAMSPISDSLFQYRDGEKLTRQQSRIIDLLKKGSRTQFGTPHAKTWSLGFFRTPVSSSFDEQNNDSGRRGIVTFDLTRLDEQGRAVRAGKRETRTTDLVVTSLGYRSDVFASTPLAGSSTVSNVEAATSGTSDDGVAGWFDPILGRPRTLAPTSTPALLGSSSQPESPSPNRGRVYDAQARLVSNVYASGWAGTNGAKGVLASTMYDAYDVGDTIVADYLNDHSSDISTMISAPTQDVISPMMSSRAEQSEAEETAAGIPKWLDIRAREAGKRVVTYDDWRRIDAEEIRRGAEGGRGKHRERLLRWEDVEAFIASSDLS